MAPIEKAHDFLRKRKKAYVSTFQPGTAAFTAYADLAKFCRAFSNEVVPGDHDKTLILAGRREAFFRIFQHLNLEPDELAALYRAVVLPEGEQ